jgi:predicted ATPase with chaperone activity
MSRQAARTGGVRTNAEADGELLDEVAMLDGPGRRLLAQAAEAMRLSARGIIGSCAFPGR